MDEIDIDKYIDAERIEFEKGKWRLDPELVEFASQIRGETDGAHSSPVIRTSSQTHGQEKDPSACSCAMARWIHAQRVCR